MPGVLSGSGVRLEHLRIMLVVSVLAFVNLARAQDTKTPASIAREHFERGVAYAKNAELGLAAREFEAAYAARPHFSVLYNLGQAYTALGKPVEAIGAFERYLEEGGAGLDPARSSEVRALIRVNAERVGELVITSPEPGLRLWLDGKQLEPQQLGVPLKLASGEHELIYADGLGFPRSRVLRIMPGQRHTIALEASSLHATSLFGQLWVHCAVPDVSVYLNGQIVAQSPIEPALVARPGQYRLRFERAGYVPTEQRIALRAGAVTRVDCAQRAKRDLAANESGRVAVAVRPPDAGVRIDGTPYSGQALPAGAHWLEIESAGYRLYRRRIELAPGQRLELETRLAPTDEYRRELERAARARRTRGFILTGAGAAFVSLAATLQVYNAKRYDDWRARRDAASESENLRTATSIQRIDDVSIGAVAIGAGLLATGVWLWLPEM
jgi:hypothetical protein